MNLFIHLLSTALKLHSTISSKTEKEDKLKISNMNVSGMCHQDKQSR